MSTPGAEQGGPQQNVGANNLHIANMLKGGGSGNSLAANNPEFAVFRDKQGYEVVQSGEDLGRHWIKALISLTKAFESIKMAPGIANQLNVSAIGNTLLNAKPAGISPGKQ